MQALSPLQFLYACASSTFTCRLLGGGKLTVTVPGLALWLPWEFCTTYLKLTGTIVVAVEGDGNASVNPPAASTLPHPPAGIVALVHAGSVTPDNATLRGRLFGSELYCSRPGEGILINVAVFAVKVRLIALGFPASDDAPRVTVVHTVVVPLAQYPKESAPVEPGFGV